MIETTIASILLTAADMLTGWIIIKAVIEMKDCITWKIKEKIHGG